jgi:Na+-driven multidrug efflux pump
MKIEDSIYIWIFMLGLTFPIHFLFKYINCGIAFLWFGYFLGILICSILLKLRIKTKRARE